MPDRENEKTITFSIKSEKEVEMKNIITIVYEALSEKGYNDPFSQIAGYIIADEPTYITSFKNARSLIRKIDRYELLSVLLKSYIDV